MATLRSAAILILAASAGFSAHAADPPPADSSGAAEHDDASAETVRRALQQLSKQMQKGGEAARLDNREEMKTRQFFSDFAPLWMAAERDPVTVIREVVRFQALAGPDERKYALAMRVLQLVDVSKAHMLEAVVSDIRHPDPKMRESVARILDRVESGADRAFSYYQPYLRSKSEENNERSGAIGRIFAVDPGQALLTCLEVLERDATRQRPIRWAEKTVRDYLWKKQYGFLENDDSTAQANEQLVVLSKRPEWWARLYVAHTYRTVPELRSEEAIARLKDDTDPFVKEAMGMIAR